MNHYRIFTLSELEEKYTEALAIEDSADRKNKLNLIKRAINWKKKNILIREKNLLKTK